MMKILIDARLYGLENAGIGRYIINLVEEISKIDSENKYVILLRKKYFSDLDLPTNWKKVLVDVQHYTFEEQFKLPGIIKNENPDLVHFPHINYPVFYKSSFVVTVHDMTMHFQGLQATTLPIYKYILKRIPYKFIFRSAVNNSLKIITPSNTVKDEIVKYFDIENDKILPIYEGLSDVFNKKIGYSSEIDVLARYGLKNREYFFYVGNAYPHKNLEKVIKAIKSLNERSETKIRFAIAGSKDVFVDRMKDFVKKENCSDLVKILGYVPDENLKILYKNSISFVYPDIFP